MQRLLLYRRQHGRDIDKIHKWATLLGLGEKSGIDLPNEIQGLVPSSEWKKARYREKWYPGETISVSIGQGQVSLTPISMAVYISTIANGGTRVTPHLVRAVDEGTGWKDVPPPAPRSTVQLKPETIEAIRDGLWLVVNGRGTGSRAQIKGYDVSGKTGTAQVISLEGAKAAKGKTEKDLQRQRAGSCSSRRATTRRLRAWCSPSTAATAARHAAPIARHVLDTFFAKQENRPLPSLTPVEACKSGRRTSATIPSRLRSPPQCRSPSRAEAEH